MTNTRKKPAKAGTAPMTEPTKWLTREEAADRLRVSKHTVDRYAREGLLQKFKVGDLQSVRFDIVQVDKLVRPAAD